MHFRAVTNFAGVPAQPALSPDGRYLEGPIGGLIGGGDEEELPQVRWRLLRLEY